MTTLTSQYKQNSHLTFKYNEGLGRHGWLRLTPAYSVRLVNDILDRSAAQVKILDPFAGTSTTGICSAYYGFESVCIDVNPFLIWLGEAKTTYYYKKTIENVSMSLDDINSIIYSAAASETAPPIHNIEKWWSPERLKFLCKLKAAIGLLFPNDSLEKTLLLVGFCRTLIELSNASFNHQSMSFNKNPEKQASLFNSEWSCLQTFLSAMQMVVNGAIENPAEKCTLVNADSRRLGDFLKKEFDLLITSPPYPNRMSYIRELRPYMYWLGFLKDAREASDLDWDAIGGTWGSATSRLASWKPLLNVPFPEHLKSGLGLIRKTEHKSGELLANYLLKYFYDMWLHFESLKDVLHSGATVHYIIGNTIFYDVVISAEKVYAEMLSELGFKEIKIEIIRKRNSKKHLLEYDVSGKWR